jgi:hypothetical protein
MLWHPVVPYVVIEVSEEYTCIASNFSLMMEVVHSIESLVTVYQTARCHNLEEQNMEFIVINMYCPYVYIWPLSTECAVELVESTKVRVARCVWVVTLISDSASTSLIPTMQQYRSQG